MLRKAFRIITGFDLPASKKQQPVKLGHQANRRARLRHLLRQEAEVGGQLFGRIPAGHRREFFCLDSHTWVWFEEWFDGGSNTMQHINVRYDIQPRGILKTVDGVARGYVKGDELQNLITAIHNYHDRILSDVYNRQLVTA